MVSLEILGQQVSYDPDKKYQMIGVVDTIQGKGVWDVFSFEPHLPSTKEALNTYSHKMLIDHL